MLNCGGEVASKIGQHRHSTLYLYNKRDLVGRHTVGGVWFSAVDGRPPGRGQDVYRASGSLRKIGNVVICNGVCVLQGSIPSKSLPLWMHFGCTFNCTCFVAAAWPCFKTSTGVWGSDADAPFQGLRVLCLSFALALLPCLCFAHQVSLGVPSAEAGQRVFLKVNYKLAGWATSFKRHGAAKLQIRPLC